MSQEIPVSALLFDVLSVPLEAIVGLGAERLSVRVPGKKAILHRDTRRVLGVVGAGYRVVSNRHALDMAMQVCAKAFPGMSSNEWEPQRATAPSTLSYGSIDLFHRTHVLNLLGTDGGTKDDPYTPFVRVTNSFNGSRALRFDFGFMRRHCSNGVIFERDLASVKLTHVRSALSTWDVRIGQFSLDDKWRSFSDFVGRLRGAKVSGAEAHRLVTSLLNFSALEAYRTDKQRAERQELDADIRRRFQKYEQQLGANAYAVFNTLTDFAARPPDLTIFNKSRATLEERAGRWLRVVGQQLRTSAPIDWNQHLSLLAEKVLKSPSNN